MAFVDTDLWPGEDWNFVFGQASFRNRTSVWSLARLGDPAASPEAAKECLRLVMGIASHEAGHMFSIRHCTAWRCNMNGANSLREALATPMTCCPECQAKIWWSLSIIDRPAHYRKLAAFHAANGFDAERQFCEKAAALIENRDVAADRVETKASPGS